MDTGRELEQALRELEAKLPQLRRLMADSTVPFAVYEEAEAWAANLLQSVRLTDSLASQLRRTLLGNPESVPEVSPVIAESSPVVGGLTEMELEPERVFTLGQTLDTDVS